MSFLETINGIEKVIKGTFKEVHISDIENIRRQKTLEYSIDSLNNLVGIHIAWYDLSKLSDYVFENIAYSKDLKILNLCGVKLNDISFITRGFTQLEKLKLNNNLIEDITHLEQLVNLKRLDIEYNKIINISALSNLCKLMFLDVSHNYISDITPLQNLKNLKKLDLSYNPISILPKWICDFEMEISLLKEWQYGVIRFDNNPLNNPPLEIVKLGKQKLKEWFERKDDNAWFKIDKKEQNEGLNKSKKQEIRMKSIKLFLASSSELIEDRKEFEIFINRKNREYIKDGVFLELILWEDFLDAMSKTRLQDEYNKAIANCDIFVSLFHTKVGKYTEEEFLKALDTFKANGKPLIYTYFKDAAINMSKITTEILSLLNFKQKLSDLGHFFTIYADINELKYKFSEQLVKVLPTLTGTSQNVIEKYNITNIINVTGNDNRIIQDVNDSDINVK